MVRSMVPKVTVLALQAGRAWVMAIALFISSRLTDLKAFEPNFAPQNMPLLGPQESPDPSASPRDLSLPPTFLEPAEIVLADSNTAWAAPPVASGAPTYATYYAGYDNGLYVRVKQGSDSFEIKNNLRSQFRVISFARDDDQWTDQAGVVRPIENRQNFDVERLRIVLSGHAYTPQLKFFVQADGDTDSTHVLSVLDGWFAWRFSDALEVQFGKRKVPGTRNWLLGAFDTRMIDRAFANEFFRPSRTTGIWIIGDPHESLHYELMAGQGFNTEGLTPSEMGDDFAFAGTIWWDCIGAYGPARPTDFEFHDELAVRVGASWVSSKEGTPGRQLEEADFLRLTDGTRLTEPNALAPGATVESFDLTMVAVDAAFKYRGWSVNGEYFWRSVYDLKANLPVPSVGLQHGFYLEGGCFVVPQRLEFNSQVACVSGKHGSTSSFATGLSYYPLETYYLKLGLDVTLIDGSPVNSTGSDILVGDSGILVRTQFQALY